MKSRSKPTVVLFGLIAGNSTFAKINRHWVKQLRQRNIRVGVTHDPKARMLQSAKVVIHHYYERPFTEFARPKSARLILVRTWDFGRFPQTWVDKINSGVDELWVYSRWTKEQAIRSGISRSKVAVVPLGFDPVELEIKRPQAAPRKPEPVRFLFVGGANLRKGIDILLSAYSKAFRPEDNVELVIKAHPCRTFYPAKNAYRWKPQAGSPRVIWKRRHLSERGLARLYRSATAVVIPYRAEGFCLPLLESMACGTPVVCPRYGPALDYCTPGNAFLVDCEAVEIPVEGQFVYNALGAREALQKVRFAEVDPNVLARCLRKIYRLSNVSVERRGRRAAQQVRKTMQWSHSVDAMIQRLNRLQLK